MDYIRDYLLSITAASAICAFIRSLYKKKSATGIFINLLSGIFLAFTVIKPIIRVDLSENLSFNPLKFSDATSFVQEGENISRMAMEDFIKAETQAYILDKAERLGGSLQVELDLDNGIPIRAKLTGIISPYGKIQLSQWIAKELGIPMEAQSWTGPH